MSFAKVLLAGAAISALSIASASAGAMPEIHLASTIGNKAIHLKSSTIGHSKTQVRQPGKKNNYTLTFTFSGNFATSTAYKNPIPLPAYTWYNSNTCTEAAKEKIKYTKDSHAKIQKTTSTGSISGCTGTTFTFYGGNYILKDKKAASDSFTGNLTGQTTSYKLDLVENFNFTFN